MLKRDLEQLLNDFSGARVLVLGDVMLDVYHWGDTTRISPEAPVPVVNVTRTENRLGGAANVALNLKALGAQPTVLAVTGIDETAQALTKAMDEAGIAHQLLESNSRTTTRKSRIISRSQQMLRFDEETTEPIDETLQGHLLGKLKELISEQRPDAVIIQDYNKGLLTGTVIEHTLALCRANDIITCVDPKKDHFFDYAGCTLFKPNLKELSEALDITIDAGSDKSLHRAADTLQQKMPCNGLLLTLGSRGIYYRNNGEQHVMPALKRKIADVSGAGDTVISVAALSLAVGSGLPVAAQLANIAGGLVCEEAGVVPVDKKRLQAEAIAYFKV